MTTMGSRFLAGFSDHDRFIINYFTCILKNINLTSAGNFACSAGELKIESCPPAKTTATPHIKKKDANKAPAVIY